MKPSPKQARILVVSAAALMLGASEASTTVGLAAGVMTSQQGAGSDNYGEGGLAPAAVRPTVSVSVPANNLVVTNSQITLRGTSTQASDITVSNVEANSSVNASPVSSMTDSLNNWMATVSDLAPGTNTLKIQASAYNEGTEGKVSSPAVQRIVLYGQTSGTAVAGPGKMAPSLADKLLIAGREYKVTAEPLPGGKFLNWAIAGAYAYSSLNSARLTFTMGPEMSLTAYFTEASKPILAMTPPPRAVNNSLITLEGTAKDNFGVSNVVVTLNGEAVAPITTNSWGNWSAPVYLAPGTNEISAYAVNNYYGYSKTNNVTIVNLSPTLSPVALDGGLLTLAANPYGLESQISFGLSAYVDYGTDTNGDVMDSLGVYTYAQTSPNDVEIVQQDAGGAAAVTIDATFSDATSGTYTIKGGQGSGTFYLTPEWNLARSSVAGFTLYDDTVAMSNYFGAGIFDYLEYPWITSGGTAWHGSYVYSDLTPDSAWVAEVASGNLGGASYYFLHYSPPPVYLPGFWFAPLPGQAGGGLDVVASGQAWMSESFVLQPTVELAAGFAPASLDGYSLLGTRQKDSVVLTFDRATFALSSSKTNDPVGVGLYTFTPVDGKEAVLQLNFLNPPGLSADDATLDLVFSSRTSATASFNNGSYHFTLAKAGNLLPMTLSGRSMTSRVGRAGVKRTFALNSFSDTAGGAGTYTFAPYSPHAGLLTLNYATGRVVYQQLTFGAAASGTVFETKAGGPEQTGTFTLK